MAVFRSMGAALETGGLVGTTPADLRKDTEGLFVSVGVVPGSTEPLVAGHASWSYTVHKGWFVTQRATGDGFHLWGNDGDVQVGSAGVGGTVAVAPGAGNSRIDVIYVLATSNTENSDTTSAPVIAVAVGTAATSGTETAPAIPAGALEIARNTMTSAATSTASAGNTISQSAPIATPRGAERIVRNTTWRDALDATAAPSVTNPFRVWRADAVLGANEEYTVDGTTYYPAGEGAPETVTLAADWALVSGYPAVTVRRVGGYVVLESTRVQRTSSLATTVTGNPRYAVTAVGGMSAAKRPSPEAGAVNAVVHYGSGLPVTVEVYVTTGGVIEFRPTAGGTLAGGAADYLTIPLMMWRAQ